MLSQGWQHALHSLEGRQVGMLRQQLQRPPVPCNITATIMDRPGGIVSSLAVSITHNMAELTRCYPAQQATTVFDIPTSWHLRIGAVLPTHCRVSSSIALTCFCAALS